MPCTNLLCTATLGQAGLRARADLQLLTRELVVVILQSCKFWERTEFVPALRDVSPQHRWAQGVRAAQAAEHRALLQAHTLQGAEGMMLKQLLPCSTCWSPGCVPQGLPAQLRETHSATIPLLLYPQLSHRELGVVSPQGFVGFF